MSEPTHPVAKTFGIFFATVGLPLLVAIAWWKAGSFDPYTQSFFTKQWIEPSPEMPGQIRTGGWVFIALGALLAIEPLVVASLGKLKPRHALLMVWIGGLLAAFGAAFFIAANSAQAKIEAEGINAFAIVERYGA